MCERFRHSLRLKDILGPRTCNEREEEEEEEEDFGTLRLAAMCAGGQVDYDPFIKSQLASAQSTLGPCVVQIWSRYPMELRGGEPRVLHRVPGDEPDPSSTGVPRS